MRNGSRTVIGGNSNYDTILYPPRATTPLRNLGDTKEGCRRRPGCQETFISGSSWWKLKGGQSSFFSRIRALPFNLFPPSSFSENVGAPLPAIVGDSRALIAHVPPRSPRFTEKNLRHSSFTRRPVERILRITCQSRMSAQRLQTMARRLHVISCETGEAPV